MIGDRADTDILFGKNNGVRTLMVGSGIHGLKDVQVIGIKPSHSVFSSYLLIKHIPSPIMGWLVNVNPK